MEEEIRPGYYKDHNGIWQKDRRRGTDRRRKELSFSHHDRRTIGRRKADQDILERETRLQIDEALEDFAAGHDDRGREISS